MRLPDFVNVTASELFDCSLPLQTRPDFELGWPKKREAEFVVGTITNLPDEVSVAKPVHDPRHH
jgi:hypothetical protein